MLSIIASAYRVKLWPLFINSLKNNKSDYEIIFVGHNAPDFDVPSNFKFIKTENIKPAQCYEIARRAAVGETIHWTADDAEYSDGWVDIVADFWKKHDRKTILSMQTVENTWVNSCDGHTFFGGIGRGALMAPLGVLDRQYLDDLGGFDRRFLYGQYENDVVMRMYEDGGKLVKYDFGDALISLDHNSKHEGVHRLDTIHQGDRAVLESLWVKDGAVSPTRLLPLEKYEDKDLLTLSQSNKAMWV